jgi:glutathione S-transferase
MGSPRRIVYQFPISHYCEKTRWHLDAKGLAYEVENVPPGLHRARLRSLGGETVPAMHDGDVFLADSVAIAQHIERTYPGRPLLPSNEPMRARVLELCQYFDEEIGPSVRLYVYGHLTRDGAAFHRRFFKGYSRSVYALGYLFGRPIRRAIRKMYGIGQETVADSLSRVLKGIAYLESALDGDSARYLAGGVLSMADITAAALLAPLVMPKGSPYEDAGALPKELLDLCREVRGRPAGQWVLNRYAKDRAAH